MRSAVMSCVVSYSRWQQLLCLSLLIGIIHKKDSSHKFREQLVVFKSLSASFLSAPLALEAVAVVVVVVHHSGLVMKLWRR
jgi:hypothetical protein